MVLGIGRNHSESIGIKSRNQSESEKRKKRQPLSFGRIIVAAFYSVFSFQETTDYSSSVVIAL